ncbi:MAG: hypothetical protein ACTSW7_01580 [Candidatus Thorarchaeota archaeon]|nr:hypothetical protein [Thermoplasmatales archaeon]
MTNNNGDKKPKKLGWLAHVATMIASVAALLTAVNGMNQTDKQDNTTKHLYEKLTLEILPTLHERIAIVEMRCEPRAMEMMISDMPTHPPRPECEMDDDCNDFFICEEGRCIEEEKLPTIIYDKPTQKKFDDFKFPAYNEFKMQAQQQMPFETHPPAAMDREN